jgi:hypothetical protein
MAYKEYSAEDYREIQLEKTKYGFGEKEVPNIQLNLYDSENHVLNSFFIDTLSGYYEEFKNPGNDRKIILRVATLSPEMLEALRQGCYRYGLTTYEIWRSQKTGKDHFYECKERSFNKIKVQYELAPEGDPAEWFITFSIKKRKFKPREREKLMNMG